MPDSFVDLGTACSFSNLTLHLNETDTVGNHSIYRIHGAFPAGAQVALQWNGVSASGIDEPGHCFLQVSTSTGHQSIQYFIGTPSGPDNVNGPIPAAADWIDLLLGMSLNTAVVDVFGLSLVIDPCGPPCPYGTRPVAGAQAVFEVTQQTLESLLAARASLWLLPALIGAIGARIIVSELCSSIPPSLSEVSLETLQQTAAGSLQLIRALLWSGLCECAPGSPTPVPPPPFIPVEPPGWPAPPVYPCDPADLCASLEEIRRTLGQLQQVVGQNYELTTLVQRYQLPFAAIPGATHGPLSGQGSFQVPRCVGLRYAILNPGPGSFEIPDVPPYVWDVGWTSVTDDGAMLQERRVNRSRFDWLPPAMALTTTVGYSLKPGASITIQELYAEP